MLLLMLLFTSLAWMEPRLAIVELLRQFQFTLLENDMRLTYRFVLYPVGNQLFGASTMQIVNKHKTRYHSSNIITFP
jgi:hypothetical protein